MGQTAPQSPSGVEGIDNGNQWGNLLQGGAKGLLSGLQSYEQQNAMMRQGGAAAPMPTAQAQPVSPDYFTPQNPMTKKPGNNVNFYGGGQ